MTANYIQLARYRFPAHAISRMRCADDAHNDNRAADVFAALASRAPSAMRRVAVSARRRRWPNSSRRRRRARCRRIAMIDVVTELSSGVENVGSGGLVVRWWALGLAHSVESGILSEKKWPR